MDPIGQSTLSPDLLDLGVIEPALQRPGAREPVQHIADHALGITDRGNAEDSNRSDGHPSHSDVR